MNRTHNLLQLTGYAFLGIAGAVFLPKPLSDLYVMGFWALCLATLASFLWDWLP